jgi:NAD(P)H-nitrite reductase large subunit
MENEKLLVVGGGMASARFVEEQNSPAHGRYAIIRISEEPGLAYNRVLLRSALAGEISIGEIELRPARCVDFEDWLSVEADAVVFAVDVPPDAGLAQDAALTVIVYSDKAMSVYRKLIFRDDRLIGAVLIGNTNVAPDFIKFIRTGEKNMSSRRDELMFGAPVLKKVA